MKHRLATVVAASAAALALPVIGATEASAATGKTTISSCYSGTISSDRHSMTYICDTPGTSYYFQAQCSWYSAGQGGSFWRSSAWTADRTRATVNCGASAYVTAVGNTVYWAS